MKKRIITLLITLCAMAALATVLSVTVFADDSPTYTIDSGTLTIGGTGTVTDENVPYYLSGFNHIVVEDGITKFLTTKFAEISSLQSVTFLGDIELGSYTFCNCQNLTDVYCFGNIEAVSIDFDNVGKIYGYTDTNANDCAEGLSATFVPLNGTCGATASDNVTWKLSADGTMTISGTGKMKDFTSSDDQPWYNIHSLIKKVVIDDGVTSVGKYAFAGCSELYSVDVSNSCQNIGEWAFSYCTKLWYINISGNATFAEQVFYSEGTSGAHDLTIGGNARIATGTFTDALIESISIGGDVDFGVNNSVDLGYMGLCSKMYIFGRITDRLNAIIMDQGSKVVTIYSYESNRSKIEAATGATYAPIPLKITGGTLGKDYTYDVAGGVLTVLTPTPLTIENVDIDTATSHRIVVKGDISANITLAGVNIATSSGSPFEIASGSTGNVTITLADDTTNTLKATGGGAALKKEGGAGVGKLTIQGGKDGTGTLITEAYSGAGIGGNKAATSAAVSNITITSGIVTATSIIGAGIGSGWAEDKSGAVSDISIIGGVVTAISNTGAGIGSGYGQFYSSGAVSNITITGGVVTATSTESAGIGSGGTLDDSGAVSNLVITGGSVKASLGCTPTDGKGNNVYLLKLANPNGKDVTVGGKSYPTEHKYYDGSAWQTEKMVYLYLAGNTQSIKVGENATKKAFSSTSGTFEDAKVALLDKNGTLRDYYADLKTAIDKVEAVEDIVKMLDNITLSEALKITHKTVTLDLNGFKLTAPGEAVIKISDNTSFHLKDSSVGKTGKIIAEDGGDAVGVHCSTTASFVMHGGTIQCSDCFSVDCYDTANFAIYGGTIDGTIRLALGIYMIAQGGTVKGDVVGGGHGGNIFRSESAENGIENYTKFLGTVTGNIDDSAYPYTITLTIGSQTKTLKLLRGQSINLTAFGLALPTDDTLLGWYLTDESGNATDKVADLAKFLDDGTTEKAPGTYTIKAKLVGEEINDLNTAIKDLQDANTALNDALVDKADTNTLTKAITDLNNAISTAQAALEKADSDNLKTLNQAIANAQSTLQSSINALTTRMTTAESKLSELTTKSDTTAGELAQAISDLSALTTALNNAKASLTTVDEELDAKITSAQTTLQKAIDDLEKELDKAITDLNKAISDGDSDLSGKISNLNTALEAAKAALEKADSDNLKALNQAITDAQSTLQTAIDKVASDLDKAITDLNKAISDGDSDLSGKISNLNTALEAAQATLEKTDSDNLKTLNQAITDAQSTLQTAINKVASDLEAAKAALEAKDAALEAKSAVLALRDTELEEMDASLHTFIVVVCVIACTSLAGNVAIATVAFILKRKRIH